MCKPCQVGKQNRTQFKSKSFTSTEKALQLVHMDLCGPSRQEGIGKENYFMLIIDDYSRLTWVVFLKEKAEAFEKFKIKYIRYMVFIRSSLITHTWPLWVWLPTWLDLHYVYPSVTHACGLTFIIMNTTRIR
jgi:hypothetical protein